MIYVIVKESGSYSDYGMELLCAYTHKPTAEAKLAELEGIQERQKIANADYQKHYSHIVEEHPRPAHMEIPRGKSYKTDAKWLAYSEEVRKHTLLVDELLNKAAAEVAAKHNIPVENARYGSEYILSIEEVEGY